MQDNTSLNQMVYASFPVRAVAFLLDLLLVNVLVLPLRLFFEGVHIVIGDSILTMPVLFHYRILDIFCYVLMTVYFVLTTYLTGQTLGKKIFEIAVVSRGEEKLEFMNVIYRETVGRFLSSLLFIGYVLVLVSDEKKSLHDSLCDTRVIYRYRRIKVKAAEEHKEERPESEEPEELPETMEPEEPEDAVCQVEEEKS